MKNTINVEITFDLDKVNRALGNTSNVGAKDALIELLLSVMEEYGKLDEYGDPARHPPELQKHVSFKIL